MSGEPPGIRPEAESSSVTFTPLIVEPSPTLAKGTISAPVGPTSKRSVCVMLLELMLLSATVMLPMLPLRPLTKMFDG